MIKLLKKIEKSRADEFFKENAPAASQRCGQPFRNLKIFKFRFHVTLLLMLLRTGREFDRKTRTITLSNRKQGSKWELISPIDRYLTENYTVAMGELVFLAGWSWLVTTTNNRNNDNRYNNNSREKKEHVETQSTKM